MPAPSATTCVGVDVSKDSLAVRRAPAAKVVTVPNSSAGLRAWLAGLPAGAHLVCEATGRNHRLLQAECAREKVPLTCLDPARARDYARSLGRLEKTDAIDAEVLRRFGEERGPAATPPPDEALRRLGDLLMVRRAVVAQITAFGLRRPLARQGSHALPGHRRGLPERPFADRALARTGHAQPPPDRQARRPRPLALRLRPAQGHPPRASPRPARPLPMRPARGQRS